jgi:ketosteroid isomerase-like protein
MLPPSDARVARLVAWYESLTAHRLGAIADLYRADATFKDPFNDVTGTPAIRRVFEHMFATVQGPRFTVIEAVCEGSACLLVWHFEFRRGGGAGMRIRGASHVTFADDGRVAHHRDYWDAAEELYEKLPLIGSLMRALRRRLRAG